MADRLSPTTRPLPLLVVALSLSAALGACVAWTTQSHDRRTEILVLPAGTVVSSDAAWPFLRTALSDAGEVMDPTIQLRSRRTVTRTRVEDGDETVSAVTAPLERRFGRLPGLRAMSSVSFGTTSIVTLQFEPTTSLEAARVDVLEAIDRVQAETGVRHVVTVIGCDGPAAAHPC